MAKDWKKEAARDIIALGSVTFYLIVMARAVVGRHWPFLLQLVVALALLLILPLFIKDIDSYLARAAVLVIFTSFFYVDTFFTIFVVVVFALMIISQIYLEVKVKTVVRGVLMGVFSAIVSALFGYYVLPVT